MMARSSTTPLDRQLARVRTETGSVPLGAWEQEQGRSNNPLLSQFCYLLAI
jgi:hypothetical protein